jgi:hypothetical protein
LVNLKFVLVATPITFMKHKYELLSDGPIRSESLNKNYKVSNVSPDRHVSTFILTESMSVLMNLKLCFEIFSVSLNFLK